MTRERPGWSSALVWAAAKFVAPHQSGASVLLTHPDRNTQNERKATQSNAKQRTQGKQNQRSRNNTSKPKTEHRGSRTLLETTDDRKPKPTYTPTASQSLPSTPPTEAYLNRAVQANQTCQGPPWILPASPVSSESVQAASKHLTASLRVECALGPRYSVVSATTGYQ